MELGASDPNWDDGSHPEGGAGKPGEGDGAQGDQPPPGQPHQGRRRTRRQPPLALRSDGEDGDIEREVKKSAH